jgi:ABC-type xylose transport system permease subunit
MSASFFLGAAITAHQENAWTGWILIVAGLVFNLDYRWRLKPEQHHLLIETRSMRVISWVVSLIVVSIAVFEINSYALDVGLITAAAGLGLNPELRQRMKLKLMPEKDAKAK